MEEDIRATIHFRHKIGASYGAAYTREQLEDFFSTYDTNFKRANLKIGQHVSVIGDGSFHKITDISLKLRHLSISENPHDNNSPAEVEILVTVDTI